MKPQFPVESNAPALETRQFVSFDGAIRHVAAYQRPDRYRSIEKSLGKQFRIARGGGYSYAAASFGKNSIVQDLTRFNRILKFEPHHGLISVEAGVTLADLLGVTVPAGLWLPVIPGYPAITIGGCVASNVHGKNPATKGTFRKYVRQITLFHPDYGIFSVSQEHHPEIYELTCGGYGLTGVVLSVTLQLERVPGTTTVTRRIEVGSLQEAYQVISASSATQDFAYSMHQAFPDPLIFGRGFVSCGHMPVATAPPDWRMPRHRVVTAANRGSVPISIFGGRRTKLILTAHWVLEKSKNVKIAEPFFDAMFPFARNGSYFWLYGKAGFAEYQMIIPYDEVDPFLMEFERILLKVKPPAVMGSLKLFKGTQRLLRFEKDGVCLALDLVRSVETDRFLAILDSMLIASGGIPYLIKDSRLPQQVVKKCYPQFEVMQKELADYDPRRRYRSEMSERLAL